MMKSIRARTVVLAGSAVVALAAVTASSGRPERPTNAAPEAAEGGIQWRCRLAQALYWAGVGSADPVLLHDGIVGTVLHCR